MATRTSSQSGDPLVSSTWGGAAPPGIGDDAVITAGHTVTLANGNSWDFGNSGAAGTQAVIVRGTLVINGALTLRGDLRQERSGAVDGTNGSLTFRPPASVAYQWVRTATGSGSASSTLTGTTSVPFTITTNLTTGNRFYIDWSDGLSGTWTNVDVSECGGTGSATSTQALTYTTTSGSSMTFSRVRFRSNIGRMAFNLDHGNATLSFANCDWRSPRHASEWMQITGSTAKTTGTWAFTGCTFHSTTARSIVQWCRDVSFGGIYSNVRFSGDIQDLNLTWTGAAVLDDQSTNGIISGRGGNGMLIDESLFLTNCDNPHYVTNITTSVGGGTPTIQRTVVDGSGFSGSDAGDFYLMASSSVVLDRILLINRAGSLFSVLNTSGSVTAKRCTLFGAGVFANAGESVSAATSLARTSSCLFMSQPTGIVYDVLTAQTGWNCDYNAGYDQTQAANLNHPSAGQNSYLESGTWWSTGAYGDDNKGQHDIFVNPQFTDSARTCATFYNSLLGSGGSFSNVRNELLKLNGLDASANDVTFTAGFTLTALLAYLRAGFTPTNETYRGAGDPDDGSPDIGAVDMAVVATSSLSVVIEEPLLQAGLL